MKLQIQVPLPLPIMSTNNVDAWQTDQAGCYLLPTMCLEYPKAVFISSRQSHNSKAGEGVNLLMVLGLYDGHVGVVMSERDGKYANGSRNLGPVVWASKRPHQQQVSKWEKFVVFVKCACWFVD